MKVPLTEMGKIAAEADLLRGGEINFGQVTLTSRQIIYQIDLKSGVSKNPGLDIRLCELSVFRWYLKPWD